MPVGAAIGVGSVASGLIGSSAAKKAAKTQAIAQENALAQQSKIYGRINEDLQPYKNIGQTGVSGLSDLYNPNGADYSKFTNSPDFGFASQQGNLATTRQLASQGLSGSGGAVKAASEFNQGLASQQFGNYFNRLMSLSNLGKEAVGIGAGVGMNQAQQIGAGINNLGQIQASGTVGAANAINGSINNATNGLLLYKNIQNKAAAGNAYNPSSYVNVGSATRTLN